MWKDITIDVREMGLRMELCPVADFNIVGAVRWEHVARVGYGG